MKIINHTFKDFLTTSKIEQVGAGKFNLLGVSLLGHVAYVNSHCCNISCGIWFISHKVIPFFPIDEFHLDSLELLVIKNDFNSSLLKCIT